MATKAEVQSTSTPQWRGRLESPVVGASMLINVTSDRNEKSLTDRMAQIKRFVEQPDRFQEITDDRA